MMSMARHASAKGSYIHVLSTTSKRVSTRRLFWEKCEKGHGKPTYGRFLSQEAVADGRCKSFSRRRRLLLASRNAQELTEILKRILLHDQDKVSKVDCSGTQGLAGKLLESCS